MLDATKEEHKRKALKYQSYAAEAHEQSVFFANSENITFYFATSFQEDAAQLSAIARRELFNLLGTEEE